METTPAKDLRYISNQTDGEALQPPSRSPSGDPGGDTEASPEDPASECTMSVSPALLQGAETWPTERAPGR